MRIFLPLVLASALLMHATVAQAERNYVPIEKRLTAEQLKSTGLDQLSAAQLELLNSLLSEEQKTVVEATKAESVERPSGKRFSGVGTQPINTRLKGEFRGWSKGTIFNLENGDRWRVIEGDYYALKAIVDPKVQVTPGKISGWYLRVEGHNPSAKVQPLD
ncbi:MULTISPECIES: hypothetical protein [unclassified Pseudoxanthomonas]|uniref:hypothetical protein n=1 Tax=unclassified Pseudoxanthomonas TaxID=2645906 RepID=UPI00307692DB